MLCDKRSVDIVDNFRLSPTRQKLFAGRSLDDVDNMLTCNEIVETTKFHQMNQTADHQPSRQFYDFARIDS